MPCVNAALDLFLHSCFLLNKAKSINGSLSLLSLWFIVSLSDVRQSGMQTLEHVSVTVTMAHPRRGNVEIRLVCPSGMSSLIGARRSLDV